MDLSPNEFTLLCLSLSLFLPFSLPPLSLSPSCVFTACDHFATNFCGSPTSITSRRATCFSLVKICDSAWREPANTIPGVYALHYILIFLGAFNIILLGKQFLFFLTTENEYEVMEIPRKINEYRIELILPAIISRCIHFTLARKVQYTTYSHYNKRSVFIRKVLYAMGICLCVIMISRNTPTI